jgi:deoxyribonuclease-4
MYGSHLSIAGGMYKAVDEAVRLNFNTVQVFTKNQQQWKAPPLVPESVAQFKTALTVANFAKVVAHDSYLINMAATDPALRQKSTDAFAAEMKRCDALGITYLVTHPGAHCGQGEACGLDHIIRGLNHILATEPADAATPKVTVCIETTAGQGSCLGCSFDHISTILKAVNRPDRLGVCIDTAHILAAGYDITTADNTRRVLDDFDRIVGLNHVKVFHLNDSKKPLGSRVDRHEHIGYGHVGLGAFAAITQDERFAAIPKILETPKDKALDGRAWDTINLTTLRKLAEGKNVRINRKLLAAARSA